MTESQELTMATPAVTKCLRQPSMMTKLAVLAVVGMHILASNPAKLGG